MILIYADDEKELCKKISDTIIAKNYPPVLVVNFNTSFIVGVNVYCSRSDYFIYTVQAYETNNRYICEYYKGKVSVK